MSYLKLALMTLVFFSTFNGLFAKPSKWLTVEVGIIGMASEEILTDALAQVRLDGYEGMVIILDTPGGALDSTRNMVKNIMDADFPVAVWVGPSGARAGSAGAFLTLSSHIAVMAEGTNIGAAHPVDANGKDIDSKEMNRKVENDTIAFIEAVAEKRGRNKEMAASFVLNSVSITAQEALENKVIDLIVNDVTKLFKDIHGKEVKLPNDRLLILDTKEVTPVVYEKSLRHKFLEILGNPNLFYLFFIAGLIGIGFELTHPGAMIPGVLGGISLILALIATSVLPVNFGAALLVIISIAFMAAEAYLPSFGILGIGGIIAFVLGSFLLIDPANEQGLRVSWKAILPAASLVIGFFVMIFYLLIKVSRRTAFNGQESLKGQLAVVREDFVGQKGVVNMDGEIWLAKTLELQPLKVGDEVKVVDHHGLELVVVKQ